MVSHTVIFNISSFVHWLSPFTWFVYVKWNRNTTSYVIPVNNQFHLWNSLSSLKDVSSYQNSTCITSLSELSSPLIILSALRPIPWWYLNSYILVMPHSCFSASKVSWLFILSNTMKNLIGISLNLKVNLQKTDTFAILSSCPWTGHIYLFRSSS